MALNREMTMEEKKIREYTESQISRAGQLEHIVFTDEQRDILLDYASTIGDQDSIRQMVWKLSEAIHSEDEQQIALFIVLEYASCCEVQQVNLAVAVNVNVND